MRDLEWVGHLLGPANLPPALVQIFNAGLKWYRAHRRRPTRSGSTVRAPIAIASSPDRVRTVPEGYGRRPASPTDRDKASSAAAKFKASQACASVTKKMAWHTAVSRGNWTDGRVTARCSQPSRSPASGWSDQEAGGMRSSMRRTGNRVGQDSCRHHNKVRLDCSERSAEQSRQSATAACLSAATTTQSGAPTSYHLGARRPRAVITVARGFPQE